MQAYLNDENLKKKVIAALEAHYKADEIIKGAYWENGKGCAVGCVLHDLDANANPSLHIRFEEELGIPEILARLIDRLFEGLPNESAKNFPLNIMMAIKVGDNLNKIWPRFAHWMLVDKEAGVIQFVKTKKLLKAIKNVADLFEKQICGQIVLEDEWEKAGEAAYAAYLAKDSGGASFHAAMASFRAAARASYAAAVAAVARASYAAAAALAAAADTRAAYAAADTADTAYVIASTAHYEIMAAKLIELLSTN